MENSELGRLCRAFRGELRRSLIRIGVCRLIVAGFAALAVLILLDWRLHYNALGRILSLAAFLLGAGALAAHDIAASLRRRWTDAEVLDYLDAVDPESGDARIVLHGLTTAIEKIGEADAPDGRILAAEAARRLEKAAGRLPPGGPFEQRALRRWTMAAAGIVTLAALLALPLGGEMATGLARLFLPWAKVRWSSLTTLEVKAPPAGWLVPQGEKLTVETRVSGRRPAEISLIYRSRSTDYWITEHVPVREDGTALYSFDELAEPVTFYLRGGDDQTERFRVEVIERPRIAKISAFYQYPPYAGLPPRRIDSGQLRGLEGTRVRIDFEATVPLRAAGFVLDGQAEEPLALRTPTTFSRELVLAADGAYTLTLTGEQGFREYRPERYEIQVIPDRPPEVRILSPGRDVVATTRAKFRCVLEAQDDFGLVSVAWMQRAGAGAEFAALSDRLTGAIPQTGTLSRAEFVWDFSASDIKGNVDVEFFVAARDCNPTGRGASESDRQRVSLLPPTQFQLQVLYEARRIVNEARIAYANQKNAFHGGAEWLKPRTGGPTDEERWAELLRLQGLSGRATAAVGRWIAELNEHIAVNAMEDDFMKARLDGIEALWRDAGARVARSVDALEGAHPTTMAEAAPEALKARRERALRATAEERQTGTILLGRMLRGLYDWENLQTGLVNTRLLEERLSEVQGVTRQLAPSTIGREIEDLSDEMVDSVLTLGKQQRATLETETSLEEELGAMALKADREGRQKVRGYLLLAFKYLKDEDVNKRLRLTVDRIDNNQLSDVAADQSLVMQAMKVVEAGLLKAGKDPAEEAVDVAALLKRDADVEAVASQKTEDTDVAAELTAGGEEFARRIEELMKEALPTGKDALSQSLVALAEAQDSVRSRTERFSSTLASNDMPRFSRLKLGLIRQRQAAQLDVARREAAPLVEASEYRPELAPVFASVTGQADRVMRFLGESRVGPEVQQLQGDVIESSREMTRFLARQKQVDDLAAAHSASEGKDDFGRPFFLQEGDLKEVSGLFRGLNRNLAEQSGVTRQSEWLRTLAPDGTRGKAGAAAKDIRQDAAGRQTRIAERMASAQSQAPQAMSPPVRPRVEGAGLKDLPSEELKGIAAQIAGGSIDEKSVARQANAQSALQEALQRLRDLMEERAAETLLPADAAEAAPETQSATEAEPAAPVVYTPEEVARELQPDALRKSLQATDRLPADLRGLMITNMPPEFPEKYRLLVGGYYQTLMEKEPQ